MCIRDRVYTLDGKEAPAPESLVRASAQPGIRVASAANAISLFIRIRLRALVYRAV